MIDEHLIPGDPYIPISNLDSLKLPETAKINVISDHINQMLM